MRWLGSRRVFLSRVTGAVAILSSTRLTAGPARAQALAGAAALEWDDRWLEGLTAGHKQIFDVPGHLNGGPLFRFSDTWQLTINTGTTIVTFLMVFLIQCTQNRDSEAVQVKLDELIRVTQGAHNALLDLEELEEHELDQVRVDYERLAERAREALRRGEGDTDAPSVERGE